MDSSPEFTGVDDLLEGALIMMLFVPREEGQGLTEYAMLLAFIALIVVVILYVLGPAVGNLYSTINANWPGEIG